MTPKQREVLEFMTSFSEEHGYAPSQQEIAKHFGFKSLGTVQNYLVRLERQGFLRKAWNARRGTEVVAAATNHTPRVATTSAHSGAVPLPLLGRVAAGKPIEAMEHDQTVDVPEEMLTKGGDHFALRVKGDSMIGDGILDGDFVVIRKQTQAANGQTVVAMIENEATIKRFQRKGDRIELQAANPAYAPIVVEAAASNTFRIEGILVGLIRRLA